MVRKSSDSFDRSWEQVQTWSSGAEASGAGAGATTRPQSIGAGSTTRDPEGSPQPKKPKTGAKAKPEPATGKKPGNVAADLVAAKKTKQHYISTMSQVDMVLHNIKNASEWSWANHDVITSNLCAAQAKVKEIVEQNTFVSTALTVDFTEMKKRTSSADFERGGRSFVDSLAAPMMVLAREVKILLSQHHARLAVE